MSNHHTIHLYIQLKPYCNKKNLDSGSARESAMLRHIVKVVTQLTEQIDSLKTPVEEGVVCRIVRAPVWGRSGVLSWYACVVMAPVE